MQNEPDIYQYCIVKNWLAALSIGPIHIYGLHNDQQKDQQKAFDCFLNNLHFPDNTVDNIECFKRTRGLKN